jgi:hypothetical protein
MSRNASAVISLSLGLPLLAFLLAQFSFAHLVADEPAPSWQLIRSLPAAEAHQAAAAEERFVYAIASEKVAKYDRKSGERVAVSTGEAKHLNSGFFLAGQLYLAHSNYPRTPEKSEIMRLDPETMELKTFKDFGNFGGSLTWAIDRDKHWWCNFAHYGAKNEQTFLVQFDGDWKEQGRWTYPPEVLRQIGQASLSGGVWDEETLLVTDHDHHVLYRLKLPARGKVLEFVGQEKAPFTGQGIARDPVTGGLVGIDRAKKQVLFAERMPAK